MPFLYWQSNILDGPHVLNRHCSMGFVFYLAWKVRWWVRSASVFNRGSWWPCPCMSWLSLSPRLLFSMCRITGSGRWLFMTNNGLKTTWNRVFIQHSNRRHRFKLASIVRCDDESIQCLFSQFGQMNSSYPSKIQWVKNVAVPINCEKNNQTRQVCDLFYNILSFYTSTHPLCFMYTNM